MAKASRCLETLQQNQPSVSEGQAKLANNHCALIFWKDWTLSKSSLFPLESPFKVAMHQKEGTLPGPSPFYKMVPHQGGAKKNRTRDRQKNATQKTRKTPPGNKRKETQIAFYY